MNAIIAAFCIIFQDIFEALKDQSQARNKAFYAGLFDSLMYLSLVPTMYVSINVIKGGNIGRIAYTLTLITIANFIGQGIGVLTGKRFIK